MARIRTPRRLFVNFEKGGEQCRRKREGGCPREIRGSAHDFAIEQVAQPHKNDGKGGDDGNDVRVIKEFDFFVLPEEKAVGQQDTNGGAVAGKSPVPDLQNLSGLAEVVVQVVEENVSKTGP